MENPSAPGPDALDAVLSVSSIVQDYRYVRAVWILALALVLYDYLLTLENEVRYMWRRPFKSRLFFFLSRYWSVLYLVAGNIVMAVVPASNVTTWFNVYINVIAPLQFAFFGIALGRLHAAFSCDKRILISVGIFFGILFTWNVVLVWILATKFQVAKLPPMWTGCIPSATTTFSWMPLIPLVLSECLLLTLFLIKLRQVMREGVHSGALTVILRDTVVYLVLASSAILLDSVWSQATVTSFSTFPPLLVALLSINGSRMMLNIHNAFERSGSLQLDISLPTHLSSIRFPTVGGSTRVTEIELYTTSS